MTACSYKYNNENSSKSRNIILSKSTETFETIGDIETYITLSDDNISIKGNGVKVDRNISITSVEDGIQGETNILLAGSNLNITTGGGSSNSSSNDSWGQWGNIRQGMSGETSQINLVAAGSLGMVQVLSLSSKLNMINISLNAQEGNKLINIEYENRKEIITFTSNKSYSSVIIGTSNIKSNKTYNVYVGASHHRT